MTSSLRKLIDAAGIACAALDAEGNIVSANQEFARSNGRHLDDVIGARFISLSPAEHQADLLAAYVRVTEGVSPHEQVTIRYPAVDGVPRVHQLTLTCEENPAPVNGDATQIHMYVISQDVTNLVRQERRRRRELVEATREQMVDEVTGLPNEKSFLQLLYSATRRARRTSYPFSLLLCDFSTGDTSLTDDQLNTVRSELGDALSSRLRPNDSVCLGPEGTLAVIAEDLGDEQDAAGVAYRLLSAAVEPINVDGHDVAVVMSIGIAVTDGNQHPDSIIHAAWTACQITREELPGGFRIMDLRSGRAA